MNDSILRHPGWWMANIWLLFLLFPLTAILTDGDQSTGQRFAGAILIGFFAAVHALGYRALLRREQVGMDPATGSDPRKILDPRFGSLWFAAMLTITVIGFGVSGWLMLGVFPFLVSYAVFNFPTRAAVVTIALSLTVAIAGPAIAGVLDEVWFMAVIIISTAAAAMLVRVTELHQAEYATLQAQLLVTEERERVARDVHDVLGHSLTAIVLKAQVVDRLLAAEDEASPTIRSARTHLSEMDAVTRQALTEIRSTVTGLRTADLATELSAARTVLADAGVELTVHGDSASVRESEALGWVVREATTNVIRHARANRVDIDLAPPDALLLYSDDGDGMHGTEGNGLRGLRERLAEVDLELHVYGADGTQLRVTQGSSAS